MKHILIILFCLFMLAAMACIVPTAPVATQDIIYATPTPTALAQSNKQIVQAQPTPTPLVNRQLIIDSIPAYGGDSTLVMQGDAVMLVDAGFIAATDEICDTLDAYGVETIDFLVLTHAHDDHIGAVETLLQKYNIKTIIASEKQVRGKSIKNTDLYDQYVKWLTDFDGELIYADKGQTYMLGDAVIDILHPNRIYRNINECSIVFKLTHGENSFLFTGDAAIVAEDEMIKQGLDITADFLKAGHHGCNDATTDDFLDTVNPAVVLIPSKNNRSYDETVEKLVARNIDYYITLNSDHMVLTSDGKTMTIETTPGYTN